MKVISNLAPVKSIFLIISIVFIFFLFTSNFNLGSTGDAIRSSMDNPLEEKIDFYSSNMPSFSTLSVVEEWKFVKDLSDYDVQRGEITGAVEVLSYQGKNLMYLKEEYLPGIVSMMRLESEDGLNWTNKTIVINGTEDAHYSHAYGAEDSDGNLNMFMQIKPSDHSVLSIGHSVSSDGNNFSPVEDFLSCDPSNGLFDDFFNTYNCESCAHGRVESLPDGNYLFTASASCERDLAEDVIGLWNNDVYKPGMILFYLDSEMNIDESMGIDYIPYCNDPSIISIPSLSGLDRVSIYCDSVLDVEAVSDYLGVHSGVRTVWDVSQYDPVGDLRLVLRIDSSDGYNFNIQNPGIVHFYNEFDQWVSVHDYSLDDLDTAYVNGIQYLYSATNSVGPETSTVIAFVQK